MDDPDSSLGAMHPRSLRRPLASPPEQPSYLKGTQSQHKNGDATAAPLLLLIARCSGHEQREGDDEGAAGARSSRQAGSSGERRTTAARAHQLRAQPHSGWLPARRPPISHYRRGGGSSGERPRLGARAEAGEMVLSRAMIMIVMISSNRNFSASLAFVACLARPQ